MRFRKLPIEIDAVQWDSTNLAEIGAFIGDKDKWSAPWADVLYISTLEGTMKALPGDWIIRGIHGEYYPCKDDIFRKTYARVGSETDLADNAEQRLQEPDPALVGIYVRRIKQLEEGIRSCDGDGGCVAAKLL